MKHQNGDSDDEESLLDDSASADAVVLPGHLAPPPSKYGGPEFPAAVTNMEPSSDVLADDLRRADLLQNQCVDWCVNLFISCDILPGYSPGIFSPRIFP